MFYVIIIKKREDCALQNKRFKPLTDKLFLYIWIPTTIIMAALTAVCATHPLTLLIVIPVDLFTYYFLVSPLFGYVELRESTVFIKFGFIVKREIPYNKIRGLARERKFYSDSMLSLKNSFDHVNIKYNKFDMLTVSVVNNDDFIAEIEERIRNS